MTQARQAWLSTLASTYRDPMGKLNINPQNIIYINCTNNYSCTWLYPIDWCVSTNKELFQPVQENKA